MDTEVIRQFLVSVGVQVDEKGLKRFDSTIKDITKTTKEFAEALTAAAVAASVAVVKISEQFEDLYYASQRLHSSVENIKAFTFGVKQMGGNADAAMQSLEAFASFLRNNPAGAGVVRGFFGVDVSDKDAAGGLSRIGKRVREMQAQGASYWQIQQRAAMVGIDESTLQAMLRGTDQWSDQFHDIMRRQGVDMDALAASSTNLMQGFRRLTVEVEAHFLGILQKIKPEVLEAGVVIAAIAGTFGAVALVLGGVAAEFLAVGVAVALLVDDFNAWRNGGGMFDWSAWSDQIDKAVAAVMDLWSALKDLGEALGPLGVAFAAGFGTAVHLMLISVTTLVRILADLVRVLVDLIRLDGSAAWAHFKQAGIDAIHGIVEAGHALGKLWGRVTGSPDTSTPTGPSAQARARSQSGVPANSNVRGSPSEQAMAYFMRQGWTREQAAGIAAGIHAEGEGRFNPAGGGQGAFGIGQWRGTRLTELRRRYGANPSLAQQLEFMQWELMGGDRGGAAVRGQNTALGTLGAYVKDFMRPGNGVAGDMKRGQQYLTGDGGSRTVTIQSKTDVTIHGAGDPHATAKATGDAIDQSNGLLLRNTKSAVR